MNPLSVDRRWLTIRWGVLLSLFPLLGVAAPTLNPQALAKNGPCPSGYTTSGSYCLPGQKARFALDKRGPCPSGYTTSGAYCLASRQARPAMPKLGASCPSGWSSSGAYCLRYRP